MGRKIPVYRLVGSTYVKVGEINEEEVMKVLESDVKEISAIYLCSDEESEDFEENGQETWCFSSYDEEV